MPTACDSAGACGQDLGSSRDLTRLSLEKTEELQAMTPSTACQRQGCVLAQRPRAEKALWSVCVRASVCSCVPSFGGGGGGGSYEFSKGIQEEARRADRDVACKDESQVRRGRRSPKTCNTGEGWTFLWGKFLNAHTDTCVLHICLVRLAALRAHSSLQALALRCMPAPMPAPNCQMFLQGGRCTFCQERLEVVCVCRCAWSVRRQL